MLLIIENKKGAEQKSICIRGTAKNPKTRKTTPAPVYEHGRKPIKIWSFRENSRFSNTNMIAYAFTFFVKICGEDKNIFQNSNKSVN